MQPAALLLKPPKLQAPTRTAPSHRRPIASPTPAMLLDDAGAGAGAARRPCHAAAILHLVSRLHSVPPLTSERWDSLPDVASNLACRARLGCHIGQRLARMLGTALLRTAVPHPLGWPLPQVRAAMPAGARPCIDAPHQRSLAKPAAANSHHRHAACATRRSWW